MDTDVLDPTPKPSSPDEELEVFEMTGQILSGRYRLLEKIGEGGMGVIYRAEHVHMRKTQAIKVLHPELTTVDEVLQRFEREAQAAGQIDHPNVCAASDFGRAEGGEFFLVMEYVEGQSLSDLLRDGPLPIKRALNITAQICSALAAAHDRGIIHRDLKPENVLITEREDEQDFVKVLDFGIARVPPPDDGMESQTLTRAGFVMGTPAYLSPEQASGGEVDHRADLYSLGIVLFEMLAGRRPFESPSTVELIGMHVTRPAPLLSRVVKHTNIPKSLDQLLANLLAKEARSRPESARVVKEEIERLSASLDLAFSSDSVSLIVRDAATRAAQSFNTMRNRVSPMLLEVKKGAPDAIPLLRRIPKWIWGVMVLNMVLGAGALVFFWGAVTEESSVVEVGQTDRTLNDHAAAPAGETPAAKTLPPPLSKLEQVRQRPEVATVLIKESTHEPEVVARELAEIYRQDNSPELAYLLARAESKAGMERNAMLHARVALLGYAEFARDEGMRQYVIKALEGKNGGLAGTIIQAHYLPEYASELQDLACSDKVQAGRRRAQAVLDKSESLHRLEPWCKLVIELERGRSCAARLETVKLMAALGDPRVLPALDNISGTSSRRRGVFRRRQRGKNSCLVSELQKTVAILEAGRALTPALSE
jgi:eukaryotic-like serine/threonine-protein kinase